MKKFTFLLLTVVLYSFSSFAQTTIASYDFESASVSPWFKWSTTFTAAISPSGAGYGDAGYCAILDVTTAGTSYSCQWANDAYTYTNGDKYQITFWAKSSVDGLILQPMLQLKSDYSANYGSNHSYIYDNLYS